MKTATLKTKTTIYCETCGCKMTRTKSIKVEATTVEIAKVEADVKIKEWFQTLEGKNCKTCQSIIDSI